MSSLNKRLKTLKTLKRSFNYYRVESSKAGVGFIEGIRKYLPLKKYFGLDINSYFRSGFCALPPISEEEAESMRKELERLGELSGKTPLVVLRKFCKAHAATNISFEKYCKGDCVTKSTYRTLMVAVRKPASEMLDIYSDFISKRMDVSKKEAAERLVDIKKKFGLSHLQSMNGCYYKLNDEQIAAALAAIPHRHDIWIDRYAASMGEGSDIEDARKEFEKVGKKYGVSASAAAKRRYNEKSEEEVAASLAKRDANELKKLRRYARESGMTLWDFASHEICQRGKFGEAHSHYRKLKHYLRTDEDMKTFIGCADKQYFMHKYNANIEGVKILLDKGLFLQHFGEESGRHFWRNVPGASYESFCDFVTNYGGTRMFVKAARSSQGVGVDVIDPTERDMREMYDEYMGREDLVIDECLIQHPDVAKFGGGCVNTLRTVTIFDNGEPYLIYCYIRIGEGEVFDNISQGGFKALIDLDKGEIVSHGYSNSGAEVTVDPVTGEQVLGSKIPYCAEIRDLAFRASRKAHELGVGFVGWDIAITANGPVLVEGNDNPALNGIEYIGLNRKTGHRAMLKPFLDEAE